MLRKIVQIPGAYGVILLCQITFDYMQRILLRK